MNNTYKFIYSCLKKTVIIFFLSFLSFFGFGQKFSTNQFLTPSDSLNKIRLTAVSTVGLGLYTGFSIGFYNAWYKNFDQEAFHLFNDYGEWRHMDKFGHFYSAYFQSAVLYKGARWTGMNEKKSIITGVAIGTLFQTTIEVMDGFSAKWGFSIPDIIMNAGGASAFAVQQVYWKEQRISFKVSNIPRPYNSAFITSTDGSAFTNISNRSEALFGNSFPERFLKDYNSQVLWASVNLRSFFPNSSIPKWFNIAIGYGAGNMYGGYSNNWTVGDKQYILDPALYPRYSSFYLSPDIELTRIKTNNRILKTFFELGNVFKIPMPTIEYNTLREFHLHWTI